MKEKLNQLTEEQEELMVTVRNEYLDKFFTFRDIDPIKCKSFMGWVYEMSNLKAPELLIVDSPLAAQYAANILENNVRVNVWVNVMDNVRVNVWDNVRANVWDNVGVNVRVNVWDNVRDNVGVNVWDNVRANTKLEFFTFSSYVNCTDLGWVSFFDYFCRIGILHDERFNKYKEMADLHIYDAIQLENICIVSRLPISIKRKALKLHSENSPAIEFKDGYKIYYWNGIEVPEQLIMKPETITKKDILSISNAEIRRCYMEKLGAKKYYDILSDGKGLKMIDSDVDNQGNIMKLWETTINDDMINKPVQFLECECPSTHHIYNIYPPNQNSKTCWQAKESTFNNEKLFVRQGDVGLVKVGELTLQPLIET